MSDRLFNINDFNSIEKDGNPRLIGNYLVLSNDNNIFVAYLCVTGWWTATGGKYYGDLHKERREVTHYLPGRLQVASEEEQENEICNSLTSCVKRFLKNPIGRNKEAMANVVGCDLLGEKK